MTTKIGTIYLVEDSEDDIFFVKRALRNAQISNPLEVSMDGQAVINKLENIAPGDSPLLMLLDLKLPRKNGFEVLEWIRSHSSFQKLVVIILTSSIEEADLDRAYKLGANAYLNKVADKESLDKIARGLKDFWLGLNQFSIRK